MSPDPTDPTDPTGPGTDDRGVDHRWVDAFDAPQDVSDATVAALHAAIGEPPADLEQRAPLVCRPGDLLEGPGLEGDVLVRLEDGSERTVSGSVPEDLPLGYHRLEDGRLLVVSPGRCWLPEGWRAWGWTVQLYAARSSGSWGIGDLTDLGVLRRWAQDQGAGFVMVNPLHAVAPTLPQETSPYLPATRRYRNPLYLRPRDPAPTPLVADPADPGSVHRPVDRDAVWTAKRIALAAEAELDDAGFVGWRDEAGRPLEEYAAWAALAEQHGPDWHAWPEELHDPHGDAVSAWVADHTAEVGLHCWLQWRLSEELVAASGDLAVLQDLPVGVDGGGADSWVWQGVLAADCTIGAPPDKLGPEGQDWGSPPLVPWRLREAEFAPFIESVRATMAGGGGIRIDHVMGLFRLWWVPPGASATEGAYVRYPAEDLLDIVCLESHRAQALVVGEDLGTVEHGVREALEERAILGYRVLLFEDDPPPQWDAATMAAVTTHDLTTLAGLFSGSDLAEQLELVADAPAEERDKVEQAQHELLERVAAQAGVPVSAPPRQAVRAAYDALAKASSTLLAASLDDAVLAERRPNVPGTTDRDNWCIPLPVLLDDLPASETARAVGEALDAAVHPDGRPGSAQR